MQMLIAFAVVAAISVVGYVGGRMPALQFLFGIVLPLAAIVVFVVGFEC